MMVCDVYGCDEKAAMRVLNRGTEAEFDMCDLHGDLYSRYEMMDVIAWYEKAIERKGT